MGEEGGITRVGILREAFLEGGFDLDGFSLLEPEVGAFAADKTVAELLAGPLLALGDGSGLD